MPLFLGGSRKRSNKLHRYGTHPISRLSTIGELLTHFHHQKKGGHKAGWHEDPLHKPHASNNRERKLMPNGGNGPCVLQNKAIDRCHYVGSGGKLGPTCVARTVPTLWFNIIPCIIMMLVSTLVWNYLFKLYESFRRIIMWIFTWHSKVSTSTTRKLGLSNSGQCTLNTPVEVSDRVRSCSPVSKQRGVYWLARGNSRTIANKRTIVHDLLDGH